MTEPSPPQHIPALVQATKRGICWSDITEEIARELQDRELQDNIETPEAA